MNKNGREPNILRTGARIRHGCAKRSTERERYIHGTCRIARQIPGLVSQEEPRPRSDGLSRVTRWRRRRDAEEEELREGEKNDDGGKVDRFSWAFLVELGQILDLALLPGADQPGPNERTGLARARGVFFHFYI